MPQLTWLVTGCSSGIGENLVHAIIARGDRVIASARNATERLQHAKDAGAAILDLDITASQAELDTKIQKAIGIYGTLDVLVNNAGYVETSTVEEASHDRLIAQLNTNLFGTWAVTRSVLPHFREMKAGIIAIIGSIGGWTGYLGGGPYCSANFALEGMAECLQQETAHFGIQSIIFEPGYYQTKVLAPTNVKMAPVRISDYEEMDKRIAGFVAAMDGSQPGDPRKLAERIIDVVKSEGMAARKPIPQRLPVGRDAMTAIKKKCEATLKLCEEWEDLIVSTDIEVDEQAQIVNTDSKVDKPAQVDSTDIKADDPAQAVNTDIKVDEQPQVISRDIKVNNHPQVISMGINLDDQPLLVVQDITIYDPAQAV